MDYPASILQQKPALGTQRAAQLHAVVETATWLVNHYGGNIRKRHRSTEHRLAGREQANVPFQSHGQRREASTQPVVHPAHLPTRPPVAVRRRSDLADWAGYRYCASHSRLFWGLRLYLVCTPPGMPILWAGQPQARGTRGADGDARDRRSHSHDRAAWQRRDVQRHVVDTRHERALAGPRRSCQ